MKSALINLQTPSWVLCIVLHLPLFRAKIDRFIDRVQREAIYYSNTESRLSRKMNGLVSWDWVSETTFEQTQNISGRGGGSWENDSQPIFVLPLKAPAFFFFCATPNTSLAGTDENEAALVSARHWYKINPTPSDEKWEGRQRQPLFYPRLGEGVDV